MKMNSTLLALCVLYPLTLPAEALMAGHRRLQRFNRNQSGQAVQSVIVITATILIGIKILFELYQGTIYQYYPNEYIGNMTAPNNITYFGVSVNNLPLEVSPAPVLRNGTDAIVTVGTTWPCVASCVAVDTAGNVSVNLTEIATGHSEAIYIDYYQMRVTGSALTQGKATEGYLWTGILFLGLGILVLGAAYILGIIGNLGGRRR